MAHPERTDPFWIEASDTDTHRTRGSLIIDGMVAASYEQRPFARYAGAIHIQSDPESPELVYEVRSSKGYFYSREQVREKLEMVLGLAITALDVN